MLQRSISTRYVFKTGSFARLDLMAKRTQHVTQENINHGIQMAQDGIGMATQKIGQVYI